VVEAKPRAHARPRVWVVEFLARGGLFHYSWQLAQGLGRAGAEASLITGRDPESGAAADGPARLRAELPTWNPHTRPRGVPRRLVRLGRGLLYVRAWQRLLRLAWRERPDVIVLSSLEHRCDVWYVRRLARGPWHLSDVWHNVALFERNRPGQVLRRAGWRAPMAAHFDSIFVHGRALQQEFERFAGRPAHAIAHGSQSWVAAQAGADPGLDRRWQLPAARPVALLLGSLSEYKGVGVLLEALALLPPRQRPLTVIAGMPVASVRPAEWEERARQLGLEADLRWDRRYVPLPELAWYFRRADLVVLPYLAAAQSGVAHLALTCGRPLIVTAVGGLPELIAGNGLVVPPRDAAALAAALGRLTSDAEARAAMGARSAHLAATRHSWEAIAADMLAAWAMVPACASSSRAS
jgi:glycosyltransferase involved in cell wall biosynthesis